MENPYQTPSLESQSSGTESSEQKSKPLRWPAFGCLLTGGLWLTMNVAQMYILWNLYTAMRTFNDKQATQRVQRINEAFFGNVGFHFVWSSGVVYSLVHVFQKKSLDRLLFFYTRHGSLCTRATGSDHFLTHSPQRSLGLV